MTKDALLTGTLEPSRSAEVAPAAKSRSHSAMLKVTCLPPVKQAVRMAVLMAERSRQQQERPAFSIVSDNDERKKILAFSNLPLPGAEEIETLIRC